MAKSFFITGTDTGVGKTFVAAAFLNAAGQQGYSTAAIKPLAAGCGMTEEGLRNDDALLLQKAMTSRLPYQQVNPITLEEPIAPHIAAARAGKNVTVSRLAGFCRGVMMQPCDLVLVEGAGGWRVPVNSRETLADLARELDLGVVLVVGMRLGCINHALLTAEAIARDGVAVAGWVANSCAEQAMPYQRENIQTLRQLLPFPCLGEIPFLLQRSPVAAASFVDVRGLLGETAR